MTFRYFPNYSLFLICCVFTLLALVLELIYLPPGETLFRQFLLWEFLSVFSATAIIVIAYRAVIQKKRVFERSLFSFLSAFMGVYFVMSIFATIKSILPVIHPYGIDETLIRIEKFLHLGFFPTHFVQKITTHPQLFYFLDWAYIVWFIAISAYASAVIVTDPHSRLRERFLFCFACVWLVAGNIVAILFSSVGPIFLSDFYDGSRVSEDMTALIASVEVYEERAASMTLFALDFKEYIMEFIASASIVDLNAASAMPSLHVGIIALMVFHSYHVNRALFIFMLIYLGVILAGSVLLGWHYAIDGYVAIVISFAVWKISGLLPAPEKPRKDVVQNA